MADGRSTLFDRLRAWFEVVFVAPTLGAVATVGAVGSAVRAWIRGNRPIATRIQYLIHRENPALSGGEDVNQDKVNYICLN